MKILHLVTSSRGSNSFSKKLGVAVVEKLQAAHPGSGVITHDLTATPFPHLEEVHLNSFFTPQEARTPELEAAVKHSDEAIDELMAADVVVIDVPMYNFNIPSTLKAWIDHISRSGKTFVVAEGVPEGLVKGKKVYLAISSGFVYSDGPMKQHDFIEPYLRFMLGFLGMTDMTVFRVEGVSVPGLQETALPKALEAVAV